MEKKTKFILIGLIIAGGFTFYKLREKPEEKVDLKIAQVVDTETIETIKKPTGEVITRRIIKKEKTDTSYKQETSFKKNDWIIGVSSSLLQPEPVYGISVDRRILGDFYIGGYVRSDKEVGVSIKVSF